MDEILELLKKLRALTTDDNQDEVITAFKKQLKPVYQLVFDEGHGVAMSQQQSKIDKLEQDKTTAIAERDQLKTDLKKIRDEGGDVSKIHADYQEQIREKESEIARLGDEVKNTGRRFTRDLALRRLEAKLAAELTEGYEEILVGRQSTQELFSFDDSDNLRVLQPGKNIPFAGDEDAQVQALSEYLLKDVKPVFKRSKVGKGSGNEGAAAGGGAGGSKKEFFDGVKERAQVANAAPGQPADFNPEAELYRRLGRSAPAGA
jgi:hypothetical protein